MSICPRGFVPQVLLVAMAASTAALQSAGGQPPEETASVLPEGYSCVVCHSKAGELWAEGTPVVEEKDVAGDLHWQKGIRCHECHGGSPEIAQYKNHRDDPDFRSVRSRAAIPSFCGRCHSDISYMRQFNPSARTDQEAEYWTSGHGRHLKASMEAAAPNGNGTGAEGDHQPGGGTEGESPQENSTAGQSPQGSDAKREGVEQIDVGVATCVDCHGHHDIRAVKDTTSPVYPTHVAETCARCHADEKLMAGRTYNDQPLRHDQYETWRQSVHGVALLKKGDISAPTCNDCHGNHGALPPGVDSVANACGTCHGKIAKLFAGAQMKHKFEEVGLPGCATCHGNHNTAQPSDDMLGMSDQAVCRKCHNPDSPQLGATLAGAETAQAMRASLDRLKSEIQMAEEKIREAERLGMMVQGPRYDLRQAFDALTDARTQVHSFQLAPLEQSLAEGLKVTASVAELAEAALSEHTYRRVWLATSLIPVLFVVGVLLLYIRTLPTTDHDG